MSLLSIVTVRFQWYFLLVLLILSVYGCGFQLRGNLEISEDVSPLYLHKNSAFELAREIRRLLVSNNIEVTDNAGKAKSQLSLISEKRQSNVLSVDSDGRVREYLLKYTVNFSIQFNDGHSQQGDAIEESISVKRTLLYNQDAVLAVTNEADILYKDMRRDLARLILLKLQAHTTKAKSQTLPATEEQ